MNACDVRARDAPPCPNRRRQSAALGRLWGKLVGMNCETLKDLKIQAARHMQEESLISRAEARRHIANELETKLALDEVKILTNEEERMLSSFRRFKAICKPGGIFKWQTRPQDGLIAAPAEPVLIETPQDVSFA